MYKLKSFDKFSLFEATLNDTKSETIYVPSRTGRKKVWDDFGISEDTTFTPINEEPNDEDFVMHIKAASFALVKYSTFKEIYDIQNPLEDLLIYQTTSVKYTYAVAIKGTKTTMIKQKVREGGSARGDYFRETAFIITMARRLWLKYRIQPEIASNRGVIKMSYEDDGEAYLDPPRAEFRNKYWEFMDKKSIGDSMIKQCDALIDRLGESAKRIKLIKKNSADISVNKFLKIAIAEERDKIEHNSSNYESLPDKISLSKWNPSDMWIAFEGYQWMVSDRIERVKDRFKRLKIFGLPELNDFLQSSIIHKQGIVGVSLKQQLIQPGKVYDINIDREKRFSHDYKSYVAKASSKSVKLLFTFSYEDLGNLISKPSGEGEVDVRTFQDDKKSPISMEVKGSKKAGHMSGKAGSYIKYVMPEEDFQILEYIRKTSDTQKIENFMYNNYQFFKPDLEALFYSDLESPKTNQSHSRLQAVFFTDWLESLQDEILKDEIVSDIIRFAKSESSWSAPHLLVK